VVRLKDERDLETLRQIALLYDSENQRLIDKVTKLTVENARLRGFEGTKQLELEIRRNLEKKREEIFRVDERVKAERKAEPKKNEGHGPRPQPQLPTMERVFELEEAQKKCSI
jgi:hypothetical protein